MIKKRLRAGRRLDKSSSQIGNSQAWYPQASLQENG